MMRFLMALLGLICFTASAQLEVGHLMNSDGTPLVGYFDSFDYYNFYSVKHEVVANDFVQGYYYDSDGTRVSGYLKFKTDQFFFKEAFDDQFEEMGPDKVSSFVIAQDSFFVVKNFEIQNPDGSISLFRNLPQYLKYISTIDDYEFAVLFSVSFQMIDEYYFFRKTGDKYWKLIPESKKDALMWKERYPIFLSILVRVENEWLDRGSLKGMEIIKQIEYSYKYRHNDSLFFDKWWNEVDTYASSEFQAKIVSIDSTYNLEYYKKGKLLYSIGYKTLDPHMRHGVLNAYYPEGGIRKKVTYHHGFPGKVIEYFPNGEMHYVFYLSWSRDVKVNSVTFEKVYSKDGQQLLNSFGDGVEILLDDFNNRQITRKYQSGQMVTSYFEEQMERIHQWTVGYMDVNPLNARWNHSSLWNVSSFKTELYENIHGSKPILFRVSEKGVLEKCRSLTDLGSGIDGVAMKFFHERPGAVYPYKTNKLRVDRESVSYEVVIPFQLKVIRFFSESNHNGVNLLSYPIPIPGLYIYPSKYQ